MNNIPRLNQCPPRMEDGRHFTDYRPRCVVDSTIRSQNNINNNFDYRMFLTNNGTNLVELFRYKAYKKNKCQTCDREKYIYPIKNAF